MAGLGYDAIAAQLREAAKQARDPERRLELHWNAFQAGEQQAGRGQDRPLRYPETCHFFMALHAAPGARGGDGDAA